MTSIGETLRRERQKRNLELPNIASELKISTRFLDAMERDDFAKLPGGVFTKSFVRQYATFLGLDGDEISAEVAPVIDPAPVDTELIAKSKPDVPGIELEMGEDSWQSVRERQAPLPSWFKSGLLLVVLMLVCSGVYWWFERPRHPVSAHEIAAAPKPAPAVEVAHVATASAPPPAGTPAATPPPSTTQTTDAVAKPASLEPAANPPAPSTPEIPNLAPNPNASVRVAVTANEPVWIRADVNGKYGFSGTLQTHETRNIDADGQVTLRLGNAGGATITLNGKPVGDVGPKGQIRTVQFTSGGFQIVSPAKLLDPLDRL